MPPPAADEAKPDRRGPIYQLGRSQVRTGTCSWTDPTLVKETDWYSKKTMTAAERLAFYARHFSLVEADSTYYRPPGEQLTRGWADRSPSGFRFNIKAYSLFTHHPTQPDTLWPDLREAIKPEFQEKRNAYAEHLDPDALAEAWVRFGHSLRPLQAADRLGAVLLQYPTWFTPKRANRDELAALRHYLPDVALAIEFRSPRWLADDDRDRTLGVLRDHQLSLVVVDAPSVSHLPSVVEATSTDLAVIRFHGRADDTWNKRDISAAERFRYLYNTDELKGWLPGVRRLADQAAEVHVLMNNCYQDYGVRNAAEFGDLLAEEGAVLS
jgi:uncharacterized protein YecE (DUF72 family)